MLISIGVCNGLNSVFHPFMIRHSYSMGSYNSPRGPIEEVAVMRNTTQTVEEYAAWPGIGGCQTKMLLGEDCSVPLNITEALFDEAHRRLINMPFVGTCFRGVLNQVLQL